MLVPVELPDLTFCPTAMFEIERFQRVGRHGGLGQVTEYQDPRWIFEYNFSGFPDMRARQRVQSWLDRLEGMTTPVLCYDPFREVPLAYYDGADMPLASGSPWGNPQVVSYDREASTFTLAGWLSGLPLSEGDYFSFQDTFGIWHLHRLLEDATVSPLGEVTVKVGPRPARGLIHNSAFLRVRNACCQGVINYDPRQLRHGLDGGAPLTLRGYEIKRAFF